MSVMQVYRMDKLFLSKRALNTSADYKFSSADDVFHQCPIDEYNAGLLKDVVHKMDFAVNPELARKYINNWVSNHTNQIIKDLFPVGMISSDTILVLANAAYFKGNWSSGFNRMTNDTFHTSPSENEYVPMMSQTGDFKILNSSELGSHVIELPYTGGDISMFVILSQMNEEHGISQLTKSLSTNTIQNIISSSKWTSQWVKVSLPKFNATHTIGILAELLKQMGLVKTFIHDAVHKAVISVDEKGTTATGATRVVENLSSSSFYRLPFQLRCNRPFIYFVFDKVTGSVLFMGVYNSPKSN